MKKSKVQSAAFSIFKRHGYDGQMLSLKDMGNKLEDEFNYVLSDWTKSGIRKMLADFLIDYGNKTQKSIGEEYKNHIKSNYPKKPRKKYKSNKSFYSSMPWKQLRYQALLRHGRQCQCCGAAPPNVRLNVDHIKPISKYPHLKLDINNLQVLCSSCNMGKYNLDETDFRTDKTVH